jgi:hypothetical protein
MIAPPCSARCSGSPTSSKAIKANGREPCGRQRGNKRSRRTRRHTRGQIEPSQQFVVEPRQWYVNYAKTDGCKRALNWRPTLPLQRRHKCGQRRRACDPHASLGRELNLDRTAGSGGRRQRLPIWRNGDCRKTDPVILPLHWLRPASEDARAADRTMSHPSRQAGLPEPDGAT